MPDVPATSWPPRWNTSTACRTRSSATWPRPAPPKQVAEFLRPFTESGAEHVTLVPAGASVEAEIDAVAEVRAYLQD